MKLGIDFGTTRTVVAAAIDGRYPLATFDVGGAFRDYVPGLVVRGQEGLLFGWEAQAAFETAPGPAVRSMKRMVGSMAPDDPVPGLGLSGLDLATAYLEALRETLVERSNLPIDPGEPLEAMVAVPAGASTRQRFLTLEAFRRAGFEVEGLLNEPSAAAIEFAHRHLGRPGGRSPKRFVVVYDLGGGTFDTSAVTLADRRFELATAEGIGRLGGDDFDAVILGLALESIGVEEGELSLGRKCELLEVCREAKEGLRPTSRRLLVDLSGSLRGAEPVVLPTDVLYERCQPLIDRTLESLEQLFARLGDHGLDPGSRQLGAVYVVGGGAAFPAVGRSLRAVHARKLKLAPQPHASTAIGLALAADPKAEIFVRESATRHFGVWREAEGGHEKVFDRIICKGEAQPNGQPIVYERRYRPVHRVGHLRFMECTQLDERGQPAGDLTPFEDVRFPYDPDLEQSDLAGEPAERTNWLSGEEIAETYTYDADGRISVVIENRTRGYRRSYEL